MQDIIFSKLSFSGLIVHTMSLIDSIIFRQLIPICSSAGMFSPVNYDINSFGSDKIFLVPQVSYTCFHKLTFCGLYEFPIYQKVNGGQVASDVGFTLGTAYRFFAHQ